MPDPRIAGYRWAGGSEAMLRYGPDAGPVAVVALPLLEEANRTRAFANTLLRALAERGIAGVLPDLPGQGDSLVPLADLSMALLRTAYGALIDELRAGRRRTYAIAIRSGALLDTIGHVFGRWYLSPQDGQALLREWTRLRAAPPGKDHKPGDGWWLDLIDAEGADVAAEIAGNSVPPTLIGGLLSQETPPGGPVRVVRLTGDPRPANRHVEGTPLWRRSEPGTDPALAALLADDIAAWIARCEG